MVASAARSERSQLARGKVETSGVLGRKSNRARGAGVTASTPGAARPATVRETCGRAPWRRVR